jgi:hypothetical protein
MRPCAVSGRTGARAQEQITAHLDDALGPDAGDQEVAAVLSRLGSPAGLAAEAGEASGSPGSRSDREQHLARLNAAVVTFTGTWKTSVTCPPPTSLAGGGGRYR